jgi:hypothetical protein
VDMYPKCGSLEDAILGGSKVEGLGWELGVPGG